jgi:ABC-type glycerol-3-phosphate transport system substrate-binding protein
MFRANALIGINSAGKQKDLAKEFVNLLFSDEIMESEFGEGFPVNKSALTKICQTNMGKKGDGMALGTDDGDKIMISYPTEQECKQNIERISSLDTPVENDEILFNMILDEAEKYLRGDITAEQAADNAISNTKTYLSE